MGGSDLSAARCVPAEPESRTHAIGQQPRRNFGRRDQVILVPWGATRHAATSHAAIGSASMRTWSYVSNCAAACPAGPSSQLTAARAGGCEPARAGASQAKSARAMQRSMAGRGNRSSQTPSAAKCAAQRSPAATGTLADGSRTRDSPVADRASTQVIATAAQNMPPDRESGSAASSAGPIRWAVIMQIMVLTSEHRNQIEPFCEDTKTSGSVIPNGARANDAGTRTMASTAASHALGSRTACRASNHVTDRIGVGAVVQMPRSGGNAGVPRGTRRELNVLGLPAQNP